MNDNKETKQAPSVEAEARDEVEPVEHALLHWSMDELREGRNATVETNRGFRAGYRAALARASEEAGEPIGWFQLKPEFGSDRIGIRWNGDGRLNDGQALYAVPQPASGQQAAHAISDAAITACAMMIQGIFMTKPRETGIEAIEARIRYLLAAKGDGHAD